MNRALLVRAAGLYLPVAALVALWLWRRPGPRDRAAVVLSAAWNLPALLLLHVLALRFHWWSFEAQGGLLLGIPVDLYLGWALLWGPVAALALASLPLTGVLVCGGLLDLLLMPAAKPIVVLGDGWLIGEAVGLAVCLLPAQLLARWTRQDRNLTARASLQVALFSGLGLLVLPAIVLQETGGSVSSFLGKPRWLESLLIQLVAAAAVPGLSAVQEFCARGLGTPLPYDPPRRLVTTGVYSYVANPMQISMSLVFALAGLALDSAWVSAAGLVSVAYSAGLAAWHEEGQIESRFGEAWKHYRRHVSRWLPRWRPWVSSPARLFIAESCEPCSEVGAWIKRRRPVGLEIRAAEDHPARELYRMTYETSDGAIEEGVAAFARALEHIHLGWAFVGWTARLPVVRAALQLVLDASGAGPRAVRRRA